MAETNKERKRSQKSHLRAVFGKHWHQSGPGQDVRGLKKSISKSDSGRSKGLVATPLQKGMCRRNRSYKNPLYGSVMATLGRKTVK